MSSHFTPASANAARIATAPISMPVVSPKRPNGCNPTPTTATSMLMSISCSGDGPERERHDLVAVVVGAERHEHQFHLHAVDERGGVALGETRLHLHLARELDVPHAERHEVLAARPRVG